MEPEKLRDQNYPETMFLNKLSRRWQKGKRLELLKREQTLLLYVFVFDFLCVNVL